MRSHQTSSFVRPKQNKQSLEESEAETEPGIYSNEGEDSEVAESNEPAGSGSKETCPKDTESPQGDEDEDHKAETGIKAIPSPGTPSRKERDEHNIHHWPYRSWCDLCVKGRAVG